MHIIKKRGHPLPQINRLGVVILISSLGFAMVSTIWAVYLESFLKNPSYVGFLTTLFTIVGLVSHILIIPMVEKSNKTRLYVISILLFVFSYIMFALLPSLYVIIIFGLLISILASIRITAFGIIVRDKSKDSSVSQNEGVIYTFLNSAWLAGPLLAGFIADKYGFASVFFLSSFFIFMSLIVFKIFKIRDARKQKKVDRSTFKVLIEYFKNKNRILNYIISGGINFWWVLIYVYVPIHIVDSGLSDLILGFFLSGVVVPLILFEYIFSKYATRVGFRKIFFTGYTFLGIVAILCFFITNIYTMLFLLIFASIGAAMVEPTTEAYFFDIVTERGRDKYYSLYNTGIDVNYSIAAFFGAIILLFLEFKFLFLLFGAFMIFMALVSLKIKNVIEERRK